MASSSRFPADGFGTAISVAEIFNPMSRDYDELRDLWYAWLFSRLHYLIAKHVIRKYRPRSVLDVGCGTGFQSFLHAAAGADVVAFDIAADLVQQASRKDECFNPKAPIHLFPAFFEFVRRYDDLINRDLKLFGKDEPVRKLKLLVADARQIPLPDRIYDHVNCCGSTLSFIPNHGVALSEMARVLRPGGTILLETEARWNADLLWTAIDPLVGGHLGFDASFREAISGIFASPSDHVSVEYPFGEANQPVYMNIRLFAVRRLVRELREQGIQVLRRWSIHSVTNIIPSTFLDTSNPSALLRGLFGVLSKIEENIPFALPGCSIVLLGQKVSQ